MNIYAKTNNLTKGREYLVMEDYSGLFAVVNDLGEVIHCVWDGCAHLNMGDWERIEKETADE